jgi:L-serine dehydratase
MQAAREFASRLDASGKLLETASVRVELYGSLALTGAGHGTDRAIMLGLQGECPEEIDLASIDSKIETVRRDGALRLLGKRRILFSESADLQFHRGLVLPGHPNAMRFTGSSEGGAVLAQEVYLSIGGGFVEREGERNSKSAQTYMFPYPFTSAQELLEMAGHEGLRVWELSSKTKKRCEMRVTYVHTREECGRRCRIAWSEDCTRRGFCLAD